MPDKKLLIADDSLTIQKVIKLALLNEGYEIQVVAQGVETIQQISVWKPHVVLIDIALPGKSAFEVKREINQFSDLENVRFVLMSSAFEKVDESQIQELTFHGHLVKPFDPANLRKTLEDALKVPPKNPQGISESSQDYTSFTQMEPGVPRSEPHISESLPPLNMPADLTREFTKPTAIESPQLPQSPELHTLEEPHLWGIQEHLEKYFQEETPTIYENTGSTNPQPEAFPSHFTPENPANTFQPLANRDDFTSSMPDPSPKALLSMDTARPPNQVPLDPFELNAFHTTPEPLLDTSGHPDSEIQALTTSTFSQAMQEPKDFEWSVQEPLLQPTPRMIDELPGPKKGLQPPPPAPPSPPLELPHEVEVGRTEGPKTPTTQSALTHLQVESIVRQEAQIAIQKAIQNWMPQLAEQIIKDEIRKMLLES